jgi:hypothetical protein
MFIKLMLPAIAIMAAVFIFLGIRMLIQKNGKFPETEISKNKEMRKLGIHCARVDEIKCRREVEKSLKNGTGCAGCSLVDY